VIPPDYTIRGQEIHEIIESQNWEELKLYLADYEVEQFKTSYLRMIEKAKNIHRELEVEFKIEDEPIVAKLDIVFEFDDHYLIADFKSSWFTHILDDWKTQARIYAYAIAEILGDKPVKYVVWNLHWNNKTKIDLPSIKVIKSWLKRKVNYVKKIKEKGDKNKPNIGKDCVFCPYILSCPIGRETTLKTERDAIEEAKKIRKLEIELQKRRQKIKNFIIAHGNIIVPDLNEEWGWVEQERVSIDIEKWVELSKEYPELKEAINVDKRKAPKIAKKLAKRGFEGAEDLIHKEIKIKYGQRKLEEKEE